MGLFWLGLFIGAFCMIIGHWLDEHFKKEDPIEEPLPFDFSFPNGAKDILRVGTNYYEYTYKGTRILVYKPGQNGMTMSTVSFTYMDGE